MKKNKILILEYCIQVWMLKKEKPPDYPDLATAFLLLGTI